MLNFSDTQPPRSEHEWPPRRVTPACSGPSCNQGRQKCSTPDACQLADDGEPFEPAEDAFTLALIVAAFYALGYITWLLWTTLQ